ncbi:MAG: tyrosine-type recombinase/integrase [Anaerolineales bacterium]|nr:tyrosine-type recombinase/integrase [Anaerolineales bacterium]
MSWQLPFATWLAEREDSSPRTIASYQGALGIFAAWFEQAYGRSFDPAQLTTRDVRAYRHELQQIRGLSASTVNVALAALRAVARWAIASGALASNPAAAIAFVELQPAQPRWMSRGELSRLLAEFERKINDARARGATVRAEQAVRDLAAVSLMGGAGLRIAEVCSLDLADIELHPRSGRVTVRQGKGRVQRTVPLGLQVREALTDWLSLRGQQPGPLFAGQRGNRLGVRQLERSFAEAARRGSLIGFTPHSLRHTFVKTVTTHSGLATAQQLAGHRRIQTTARYAAPGEHELAEAVEGVLL